MIEHARGLLYGLHRFSGMADLTLGEALDQLRDAGHVDLAEEISVDLLGRNVLDGRWSFQVVEEYDDGYYRSFKDHERRAREQLVGGRRHVFESEMKEDRRTAGRGGHEARPD